MNEAQRTVDSGQKTEGNRDAATGIILITGRYYRNCQGGKRYVVGRLTDHTCVVEDESASKAAGRPMIYRHAKTGEALTCFGIPADPKLALVEEWKDAPAVDWSKLPAWAQWVAMDSTGTWRYFERQPTAYHSGWLSTDRSPTGCDYSSRIHESHLPGFSGEWKDSLVRRPQPEGAK
jgi:hypothetical protein